MSIVEDYVFDPGPVGDKPSGTYTVRDNTSGATSDPQQ